MCFPLSAPKLTFHHLKYDPLYEHQSPFGKNKVELQLGYVESPNCAYLLGPCLVILDHLSILHFQRKICFEFHFF